METNNGFDDCREKGTIKAFAYSFVFEKHVNYEQSKGT